MLSYLSTPFTTGVRYIGRRGGGLFIPVRAFGDALAKINRTLLRLFYLPDEKVTIVVGEPENVDHVELAGRFDADADADAYNAVAAVAANSSLLSLDIRNLVEYPAKVKTANPNAIILTDSKRDVQAEGNVVVDGSAKVITLTDGHPFGIAEEIFADKVIYTRSLQPGVFETLYIPFAATDFGGSILHDLYGVNEDGSINSVVLSSHMPHSSCLIYSADGGEVTLSAENAVIITEADAAMIPTFFGNYLLRTSDEPVYGLENGQFVETNDLMPFRSYFTKDAFEGIVTSINSIVVNGNVEHEIFNIQGVKINSDIKSLLPGFYVIDGKKVFIR